MIYLDNASTTPVARETVEVMDRIYQQDFFNPSASYSYAVNVKNQINKARAIIADRFNAKSNEIFFTSCATESNNWALNSGFKNKKGNIVVSKGEHASVYEVSKQLASKGLDVRYANLNSDGSVDIEHLLSLIDKNTSLVSIIHASNETGVINDLHSITQRIKTVNNRTIIHSDGVQAYLKTNNDVNYLGVDLYSISGHKVNAPKGIGCLYIRNNKNLAPYIFGGGQESGYRSGTENVAGILALANATERYLLKYDKTKIDENYNFLVNTLSSISDCKILGNQINNTHLVLAVSFLNTKAEILQSMMCDDEVLIGRGSACSSRHKNNRILSEMAVSAKEIEGAIRLSLSPWTTLDELKVAIEKLKNNVEKLRGKIIG